MDIGPLVSRKAQFVPAFSKALSSGFQCHKVPMSNVCDEDAFTLPTDEAWIAMKNMSTHSYHDSVKVIRNYGAVINSLQGVSNEHGSVSNTVSHGECVPS